MKHNYKKRFIIEQKTASYMKQQIITIINFSSYYTVLE